MQFQSTARPLKAGSEELFGSPGSFAIVFGAALFAYVLQQYVTAPEFLASLRVEDTDDAMRLLSVRDLLAGQGWFDMVQYRALPPEGVSLHWSRFIDAALAGLNILFLQVTDPRSAELLASAVWPATLFVLYLTLVGRTTRAVFGVSAACFAMIATAAMPILASSYFPWSKVDHHNVQLLCMFAIFAALLVRSRPLALGVAAGCIAAFSLAIGLETIVFIAVAGMVLTVQYAADAQGAPRKLLGFGVAVGIAAPSLFMAQTNPEVWGQSRCDALSPPFLAITTSAAVYCILMVLAGRILVRFWQRLALALVLAGLILFLLYPLMQPCLAGPYASLPEAVQQVVIGNIIEALPAPQLAKMAPVVAVLVLFPLFFVTALMLVLVARSATATDKYREAEPLAILLVFLCLGVLASFFQARGLVSGLAVLPVACGVIIARMANRKWAVLRWVKPVAVIGLAALILFPQLLVLGAATAQSVISGAPRRAIAVNDKVDAACSTADRLSQLQVLPPALIMAPLNLGPTILLYTPHSVTGVPYHRSAEAMANGVVPFIGDAAGMAARVQSYDVDMVLVCDRQIYGGTDSMGSRLARGELPVWLEPVDIGAGPIRIMKVLRGANGALLDGEAGKP